MATPETTIRNAVYDRIAAKKVAATFTDYNAFTLEKAYEPHKDLEDLNALTQGIVYVVRGATDQKRITRSFAATIELPIMVGFQRTCDPTDITTCDQLADFVEELKDVCRKDVEPTLPQTTFDRVESAKDENGVPYQFVVMRQANIFEAYFTAFYKHVKA